MMKKKMYETLCGCHVTTSDGIQFCGLHSQAMTLANELSFIRGYFLQNAGGEDSPFVKRIDNLIPRRQGGA